MKPVSSSSEWSVNATYCAIGTHHNESNMYGVEVPTPFVPRQGTKVADLHNQEVAWHCRLPGLVLDSDWATEVMHHSEVDAFHVFSRIAVLDLTPGPVNGLQQTGNDSCTEQENPVASTPFGTCRVQRLGLTSTRKSSSSVTEAICRSDLGSNYEIVTSKASCSSNVVHKLTGGISGCHLLCSGATCSDGFFLRSTGHTFLQDD